MLQLGTSYHWKHFYCYFTHSHGMVLDYNGISSHMDQLQFTHSIVTISYKYRAISSQQIRSSQGLLLASSCLVFCLFYSFPWYHPRHSTLATHPCLPTPTHTAPTIIMLLPSLVSAPTNLMLLKSPVSAPTNLMPLPSQLSESYLFPTSNVSLTCPPPILAWLDLMT